MTDTSSLPEQRAELKRHLAANDYATLLDVLGNGTGHLLQKLTRNAKALPFWYSVLVAVLVILLIGLLVSGFFGELNASQAALMVVDTVVLYVGLITFKFHQQTVVTNLRDHVVDAIESSNDLADLEHWLSLVANKKVTTFFALIFGVLAPIPGLFFIS